jgi:hypothetical protein
MGAEITIEQAVDIGHATLASFKKEALEMTFNDVTHELYNMWFKEAERDSGDAVKAFITLEDTGNAKMISLWEEDTYNLVNTDHEIKVDWVHATTNMTYNRVELAMNTGNKVRIYNYLVGKQKNMYREFAELLQKKLILSPLSASDKKNPHGLASWLSLGTDGSPGAHTGYQGKYYDGSGTAYNVGTISSGAADKPRWASYYADHNGLMGDNLLDLLARATRKTHFMPTLIPTAIDKETPPSPFRYYTNDAVLGNLEALARKMDDNVGPDLAKYFGRVLYKGIPFMYVDMLDSSDYSTIMGTDPIFGVNHDYFKVMVLRENDFVLSPPTRRDGSHNVLVVNLDVSFAVICENRQRAGFLISEQ